MPCKFLCLGILAFLISSTNALQQTASGESADGATVWSEKRPGQTKTSPDEYHRAAKVPRNQCTKLLKPTLLFIGQAYSGSTSLADQMALHSEISLGDTKEHHFFTRDYHKKKSEAQYQKYLEQFWVSCNTTVAADATMDYLEIPLGTKTCDGLDSVKYVLQRMGKDIKIMAMFRDPVDLLFHRECSKSGQFLAKKPRPPFTVEEPWNVSKQSDRVTRNLGTWLEVFPNKKNWLFLSSDEYFEKPQQVLNKVFKFAGVQPFQLNETSVAINAGRRRCTMKATSEERKAYWSISDNKADKHILEKMTGLSFQWHKKS